MPSKGLFGKPPRRSHSLPAPPALFVVEPTRVSVAFEGLSVVSVFSFKLQSTSVSIIFSRRPIESQEEKVPLLAVREIPKAHKILVGELGEVLFVEDAVALAVDWLEEENAR
ncbi:MAG: hypothetical protein ACO35C_07645, partial [Pontimonas sp.]